MKIDIIELAKDAFKDKELILESVSSNKIQISYKGKTTKPKPIILSKKINLNKGLGEFCGLYYGEGFNSKKSCRHITQFTNSEPELIRKFMMFMKNIFYIKKNSFTFKIKVTKGNIPKKEIMSFWKKELRLNTNSNIQFSQDSEIRKKYCQRIMIYFGNTVFRTILDRLIETVYIESTLNHEVRCGFLSGLFAGEGCVNLNNNSLFSIEISQGYKNLKKDNIFGKPKREYIKNQLNLEGIKTNNNKKGIKVIVTNLKNLEKFYNLKLHTLHPKKSKKFKFGFMNLRTNERAGITNHEAEFNIIRLLLDKGPLSITSISKLRDTKNMTSVGIIKGRKDRNKSGLLNKGYLEVQDRIKIKDSKKPVEVFSVTEKGKVYLDKLKEIVNSKYIDNY